MACLRSCDLPQRIDRSRAGAGLEAESHRIDTHTQHALMRSEVKRSAVLAERAVGNRGVDFDAAQSRAVRTQYQQASRRTGEQDAIAGDAKTVGQTGHVGAEQIGCVGEYVLSGDVAPRIERVRHPDRMLRIGIGNVERASIRRERNAVRKKQVAVQQMHAAIRIEPVHTAVRKFPVRRCVQILQAIGRVSEEDAAVIAAHHIIRTV